MAMTITESLSVAETLGGANFWYGLRMRPSGLGCHPRGTSASLDSQLALEYFPDWFDKVDIRHGAIAFSLELSSEDVSRFELVPLSTEKPIPLSLVSVVDDVIEALFAWLDDDIQCRSMLKQVILELEDDSGYLINMAARHTSFYKNRKINPGKFNQFREHVSQLSSDMLIANIRARLAS